MLKLTKPPRLAAGDTIATVSLSWGGAGDSDILWRYNVGKRRLEEQFGLRVVEMPHTLRGSRYVYDHPEERARDLMAAFADPAIKGIFSCIGGDESVRILPYIDFDIIRQNPKVFLGYSDSTTTHFICLKAGLSSFYGPSVLAEFGENIEMFDYTARAVTSTLFEAAPLGEILPVDKWTGEIIPWQEELAARTKTMRRNTGYEFLQGRGTVRGPLIGGCLEVMEMLKGSAVWPEADAFAGAVLFFETSEETPDPGYVERWLRSYGTLGILQRVSAVLFGKPYQEKYRKEYKAAVRKVTAELGLETLPIVCNMTFGHNQPMCVFPYGAMAEVDCERQTFHILEPGVV